jgi:hypothetical protein
MTESREGVTMGSREVNVLGARCSYLHDRPMSTIHKQGTQEAARVCLISRNRISFNMAKLLCQSVGVWPLTNKESVVVGVDKDDSPTCWLVSAHDGLYHLNITELQAQDD